MKQKSKEIEYEVVSRHFCVDETSPSGLRWRHDVRAGRGNGRLVVGAGDVAGCLYKGRYRVRADGVKYLAHRVVYCLVNGKVDSSLEVDHKDGNAANNRPLNLREVTGKINTHNGKMRSNNSSGVKGVFKKRATPYVYWVAACMVDGKAVKVFFSINSLGDKEAKYRAQICRQDMIFLLNQIGEDYTHRHNRSEGNT